MLNYINIELDNLVEESFDASKIIENYRDLINSSNYILKGEFYNGKSNGTFDDSLWIYQNHITKGYAYFHFKYLYELRLTGIDNEYIDLIKSWVANMLDTKTFAEDGETITPTILTRQYNCLLDFIKISNNFSNDFIDDTKGSGFEEYFTQDISDTTLANRARYILDFIEFTDDWFFDKFNEVGLDYISKLQIKSETLYDSRGIRVLPDSKNIILFDTCIKDFFDTEQNYNWKMYFYPLLIWWMLTTVIPFRASEFCLKIKRNCLAQEDGFYFIYIDRLKKKRGLNSKKLLPVLKKVQITKELYDLISDYIDKTNEFGYSETLISVPALIYFRLQVRDYFGSTIFHDCLESKNKYFTNDRLSRVLKNFYEKVIDVRYKDMDITQNLKPNDTRHLAFTSLILQGFSPVEVAIIGGHRTLASLDTYTSSCNTYIDTEVIVAITKGISEATIDKSSLKQLVFNKKDKSKINLETAHEIEIDNEKMGYCTANFNSEALPCEDNDCFNCSKWWCAPTERSYTTLLEVLRKRLINEQSKLNRDIEFMKSLIAKTKVSIINEFPVLEKQDERELKSTSLRLNSTCKRIVDLKTQLITPNGTQNMVTELCDIDSYLTETSIFNQLLDGE